MSTFMSTIISLRYFVKYCRERPCIKGVLVLEIYWLIESKVVLTKQGNVFFSEDKKQTRVGSPPQMFFYVNGKQFKSKSDQSEKKITTTTTTQKTHMFPKQKQIIVIQPEDFNNLETGSVLQNEKTSRKSSVLIYSFWFYQQNHSTKQVFFAIFSNILEHFGTVASEIFQESILNSFFSIEAAIRRSCNKNF